ncbi:phage major tail tube protein [Marinibactrum halimedae]|uniref:Phage major tail tube protein n=1 Tax=Marinibactrum halimedae TaxID=1444977 RepID=A0AA37TBX6_9GAMM|nr:phage major tail tube protein [Marinibactrum halimedae]MCD9460784.1 phage major tail tube protein [Marinibactrum halimedae]GLS27371.1 phage major tail tube protein [Marinibactrum halimedae]
MLPKVLKNFNLFVDGQGYAGRVENITLPRLVNRTEEFRMGGLDAPVQVDMGMEKLECDMTLSEYDPFVIKQFGIKDNNPIPLSFRGTPADMLVSAFSGDSAGQIPFVLRGGLQVEDAGVSGVKVLPVVVFLEGNVIELDLGQWAAGQNAPLKFRLALRYYRLQINSEILIEIDVNNRIRNIAGVNQIA